MRRAVVASLLIVVASATVRFALIADEPLKQDDPLLKALEQLRRESAELRRELGGVGGSMSAPSMSGAAPTKTKSSVVPQPTTIMPRSVTAAAAPAAPLRPAQQTSKHWSFQPVRRPTMPPVQNAAWAATDLDRLVLAKMEAAGLQPGPDASPETLCRRVYLDLTGLPPTPEEVEAFVGLFSRSPDLPLSPSSSKDRETGRGGDGEKAYELLVDRLLASPRFGERWARHWLDVVRYADSVGRSWNAPFTYAWRYRDYVIDAFNADVPYDRFVTEQLAGDLLTSNDVDERRAQLTALGFLGLGSLDLRETSGQFDMDQIDDQIDVTTRAFLGLTIACARCHDHKYDPVSMHDYYALAGIFWSTDTLPGQANRGNLGGNGYVDPDRLVMLPSGKNGNAATSQSAGPVVHSMSDYSREWSSNRNVRYTTDPNFAMSAREGKIEDCELRIRGEAFDYGPAVPRGDVRIPSLPKLPPIPKNMSGRMELARWIASPQQPLTARVMANRVWQHLFGRGIVATVDDFGTTGEAPSHPELLDWLASEFVARKWSTKQLIRTIVLSRTYRLASTGLAANDAVDPNNVWYWRENMRALELEPLRDSLLFVGGLLDESRPYGIQVTGHGGKQPNKYLLRFDDPYRTIYLPVMRSLVPDVYGTFDFPDPTQIRGLRDVTTVPTQALFLMNDDFAVDCAEGAAERLLTANLDDPGRVRRAYLQIFGRAPTAKETTTALAFITDLQPDASERDPQHYRWTTFVQALLAAAEFRYVR